MIKLSDITVAYGQNTVYQNFNFNFDVGVNVVLGKSGCGKTTLLNVILGLIPYSGSCDVDGRISVVFQQPSLAPVSVWNNINLVLPRGNNDEKIRRVLTLAQIDQKAQQNALTLSGGEQQRVSLARAFAADTQNLLMDEPFSNLDYGIKVQLRQTLGALLSDAAITGSPKTVVLVTHDIDEALALADNVILAEGRPCALRYVAKISAPRAERSEFDSQIVELKRQLQSMLL